MNFIKGIVDGILATDSEAVLSKTRNQNESDDQDSESERINRNRPLQNRNISNDNVFITNTISQLSDIYRTERENCLNGLLVRYGEGRVQQLSQVLKSNHEAMLILSQEFQNNLASMGELNKKAESVAVEQLKLKSENNTLVQLLNSLTSENENLKSQLKQANVTIKSNENHIVTLKELLKDNKNTFENMKNRCEEFYRFKSEIKDLKKKLEFSENQIKMLTSERDQYWGDPNRVLNDEDYKRRIAEALERQDRALRVAKAMATQRVELPTSEKKEGESLETRSDAKELEENEVTELKVKVERLEDENTHLKEINDNLHTMYADLNNQLKEAKNNYLKEALESLSSMFPARTNPIQLVFVQPTAVLDLDFDEETLHKYSNKSMTHRSDSAVQSLKLGPEVPRRSTEIVQSTSERGGTALQPFEESSQALSHFDPDSYRGDGYHFVNPLHEKLHSAFRMTPKQKEKYEKKLRKFNLRSKVIQYMTGLDGSPKALKSEEGEQNLLSLESPHVSHQIVSEQRQNITQIDEAVSKASDKTGKSGSWNSDWDFFEDEVPISVNEFTSPVETTLDSKSNELNFDFILDEEKEKSQNNLSKSVQASSGATPDPPHVAKEVPKPAEVVPPKGRSQSVQEQDKTQGDLFSDDIFDSIINEQEFGGERSEPAASSKKGAWDLDFDDEMFKA